MRNQVQMMWKKYCFLHFELIGELKSMRISPDTDALFDYTE